MLFNSLIIFIIKFIVQYNSDDIKPIECEDMIMDDITKKHFIHLSLIAVFFSLLTIIGISLNVYFTVIVLVFLMILFLLVFA